MAALESRTGVSHRNQIHHRCAVFRGDQECLEVLITLVLLRCPLNFVCRCKCLSKKWNRNLSASSFRLAYICLREQSVNNVPSPNLLGFFHFRRERMSPYETYLSGPLNLGFSFLPTDVEGEPLTCLEFLHNSSMGHFRCISDGLVLCGDYPSYHVFNPITRECLSLPRANFDFPQYDGMNGWEKYELQAASAGFSFRQCDNDFMVVVPFIRALAAPIGYHEMMVDIYSSQTGLWKQSVICADIEFQPFAVLASISFDYGTFIWFIHGVGILAYNPEKDDKLAQVIMLPYVGHTGWNATIGKSRDGFLQCAVDDTHLPGFLVYTLPRPLESYYYKGTVYHREWNLKYRVRLDMLDADWSSKFESTKIDYARCAFHIAFDPSNPQIFYFRLGSKILSYDLEEGCLREIAYRGDLHFANENFCLWPYIQPRWPSSPSAMENPSPSAKIMHGTIAMA